MASQKQTNIFPLAVLHSFSFFSFPSSTPLLLSPSPPTSRLLLSFRFFFFQLSAHCVLGNPFLCSSLA
ncbi:unnamed protein product [Citrullus colocynthis]|uniref:Uncharacterized protein n=1 Tax=Citrullus colocynthis TaxID=252529 RepID=A0ABP0XM33_9ROSI